MSDLDISISSCFILRKVTVLRSFGGFATRKRAWTATWSPAALPLLSHNTGSCMVGRPPRTELVFRVIRTSNVWPLVWVAPTTCCNKPCSSRVRINLFPSLSFGLSTWKCKSPVITNSSGMMARLSRQWVHSSKILCFWNNWPLKVVDDKWHKGKYVYFQHWHYIRDVQNVWNVC